MKTLLTIKRHILEMIEKKPQSLNELRKDLDINVGILNEVLLSLIKMKIIKKIGSNYQINSEERQY